jgi:hypothetical protein
MIPQRPRPIFAKERRPLLLGYLVLSLALAAACPVLPRRAQRELPMAAITARASEGDP